MASFVTSDGVRLYYERVGSGPRVYVCIGGPANDARALAEDLAPLSDEFELVHHEYRGCGRSASAPEDTYTFEQLADDLDELRQELGDDHINVVGHSMGGFVAEWFGARHPAHARRIVLAGTYATTDPREFVPGTLRALGILRFVKLVSRGIWFLVAWSWRRPSIARTRRLYAIWGTTQEGPPAARAAEIARFERMGLPLENDNVPALQRLFRNLDIRSKLREMMCPVLVLYGDRDAAAVGTAHIFRDHLAHAEFAVLPGVGHELFFESPDESLRIVRPFLRG